MRPERLAVCQCGHEARHHHDELGCCSCACREFVLPGSTVGFYGTFLASNVCQTCGARYETKAELDAHLKAYRERNFQNL
jgi:hypothetical protein